MYVLSLCLPRSHAIACIQSGDYGRLRTWASVAWVAFAPLSGWVIQTYGARTGIAVYAFGSILALPPAWFLPLHALQRKGEAEVKVSGIVKSSAMRRPVPYFHKPWSPSG